ncbi:MAG: GNAT family N-acetyltransferase [Actinomycetaceae bacterium]|nr:GNAT family N-acetyltransferase [Actinomycetaceae bacterium]
MIDVVATDEQLERCWAIRLEVFVGEQKVPDDEEIDALDIEERTVHLLASRDGADLGTLRLYPDGPGVCHIGRVAVKRSARGLGVGRELMDRAAQVALERFGDDGGVEIHLSAQEQAIGFYEACGYELIDGPHYLDAGIWHRDMVGHFPLPG